MRDTRLHVASRPRLWLAAMLSLLVATSSFTCDEGKTVSESHLNDDYCDCADASDEPLTGACPGSKFLCAFPRRPTVAIWGSRVNDGVCDCCDGSDEWRSSPNLQCPDRCHRHALYGRAWMWMAGVALLGIAIGSLCLCQRQPPETSQFVVELQKPDASTRLGVSLANRDGRMLGWPRIDELYDGIAAQSGQLRAGDVLTSINGQPARGHEGAGMLLRAVVGAVRLTIRRTEEPPPAPAEEAFVRGLLAVAALCALCWPAPLLGVLGAEPSRAAVGAALVGASVGAHAALLLAAHAQEAVGRGLLVAGGGCLAAALALLLLSTPAHAADAPTVLVLMLAADAAALLANRRGARGGALAFVAVHACVVPAIALLPDATREQHAAALALALFNLMLRVVLWAGGRADDQTVGRLGLCCLAAVPVALRVAELLWEPEPSAGSGLQGVRMRRPDEL